MKAKYEVQFKVAVCVSLTVNAESMEDALAQAKKIAEEDPVRAGLIKIGRAATYHYDDTTQVAAVIA